MKDKNNYLENYLRKKLEDYSETSDGWDKPDSNVWAQAQQGISVFDKSKKVRFNALWKVGFFLFLLFSIGYILFIQRENQYLKLKLDKKTEEIHQNQEIAVSEKKLLKETASLIIENEKLAVQNETILKQKNDLEQLVKYQQKAIFQLKNDNQTLQKSLKNNTAIASTENTEQSNEKELRTKKTYGNTAIVSEQNITLLSKKLIKLKSLDFPKLNTSTPLISFKSKRKKFETGYEYALLGLNIPIESGFDDFDKTSSNNRIYSHAHGFYFAYAPKKNLYIRTGLRTTSTSIQQSSKLGVVYDKSGEYVKQNGEIGNDFGMSTKTPFSDTKSDISVDIPQGADLENGDLLLVNFSDYQDLRYFQIPLGLEYFHGRGKWQWHLQGGVQWNQIVLGNYTLKTEIYAKDQKLPIDKIKVSNKPKSSKQYFSTYAGFGLNFQISEAFHARADLAYTYDFIKNTSKDFSNSQLFNNAFKLGLNYRF